MSNIRNLTENATDMIVDYVRANIETALSAISAEKLTLPAGKGNGIAIPKPREYFITSRVPDGYAALQAPSIFVVCDSVDFQKARGANFLDGTMKFGIAAIVEGQTLDFITRGAWRYQAALSQILDNLGLTSVDGSFRIKIIVQGAEFSEEYDNSSRTGNAAKSWRKGVLLKCDVEFYEALKIE